MKQLIIATRNRGKAREFVELLQGGWEVKTLLDFPDLPEVVEDGKNFEDNAIKKAVEISRRVAGYVLADDSGLEVDYLLGVPGVHSARYAGEPSNDQKNNDKLLQALAGVSADRRGAQFRCVLALAQAGHILATREGVVMGRLLKAASGGANGFGYDPLFVPDHQTRTFAELDSAVKHRLSHRGKATRAMLEVLATI